MAQRVLTRAACVVLLVSASVSGPGSSAALAEGCSNIPASAIDQYCEMTPTAAGGRTPVGAVPLAAVLTASQRRRVLAHPGGQRLAALPAPVGSGAHPLPRVALGGPGASPALGANVSPLSLSLPLIAILVLSAAGLLGTAAVARWRRRSGS